MSSPDALTQSEVLFVDHWRVRRRHSLFWMVASTALLWGGLMFGVFTYEAYQQGTPTATYLALLLLSFVAWGAFMGLILWSFAEFRYRRYLKRYPSPPAKE